ncbi:hypothetical protein EDB19DRAFT_1806543, partial [Suillus lakei]
MHCPTVATLMTPARINLYCGVCSCCHVQPTRRKLSTIQKAKGRPGAVSANSDLQWANYILDLSSKPPEEPLDFSDASGDARSALPEPASPFPGQAALALTMPRVQSVAGNKRHTLPNNITAIRAINPNANFRP